MDSGDDKGGVAKGRISPDRFFSRDAEKTKLKEIVDRAHQQRRRVRFWGGPDRASFWRELIANGVDLINTDDLEGAQKFLLHEETGTSSRS